MMQPVLTLDGAILKLNAHINHLHRIGILNNEEYQAAQAEGSMSQSPKFWWQRKNDIHAKRTNCGQRLAEIDKILHPQEYLHNKLKASRLRTPMEGFAQDMLSLIKAFKDNAKHISSKEDINTQQQQWLVENINSFCNELEKNDEILEQAINLISGKKSPSERSSLLDVTNTRTDYCTLSPNSASSSAHPSAHTEHKFSHMFSGLLACWGFLAHPDRRAHARIGSGPRIELENQENTPYASSVNNNLDRRPGRTG